MIFKIKIFVVFIFVLEMFYVNVGYGQKGIDIWSIKKEELGQKFFYESFVDNTDKDKTSYTHTSEYDGFFYDKKKYEQLYSLSDLSLMLSNRIGREATRRFFYRLKETKGFSINNIKTIIERYDSIFGKTNTDKLLSHGDVGFYMDDYTSVVLFMNGLKNLYSHYGGENYKISLDKIKEVVFNNFYWIVFNNSKRFSSNGIGVAGVKDFVHKFDILRKEKIVIIDFLEGLDSKDFFYFLNLRSIEFSFLIDQIKSRIKDSSKVSFILEDLNWEKVFNIFYKIRILGLHFNVQEENPYTGHFEIAISNWDEKVGVGFKKETVSYWTDLFLGTEDVSYNSRVFKEVLLDEIKSYIDEESRRIDEASLKANQIVCSEFFKYL